MANDLNRVTLIGRLTRDPEIRTVASTSVCNFSLATNRTYVANGEKKEETHFFDCEVWGKLADVLKQYATKGKQLAVEGRLQQSVWDAPDGKKNSKVRIRVENFQLLGGNTGGGSSSGANSPYSQQEVPMEAYDPGYASDINEDDSVF